MLITCDMAFYAMIRISVFIVTIKLLHVSNGQAVKKNKKAVNMFEILKRCNPIYFP